MIETINIVNKEVARSLGYTEDLVKAVNKFYWKNGIKAVVQSGDHTSIRIKNIGTLAISRAKVNAKIRRVINTLRDLRRPDREFKTKSREVYMEEKYTLLRMLLARRNDIAIVYKTNIDNRYDKVSTTSMGEQTPDCTGPTGLNTLLQGGEDYGEGEDEDM